MEFNKIETVEQALDLAARMPDVIAIDTEFVKGDPRKTQLLSVIVADSERAWVIPPSLLPILTPTLRSRKAVFLQDYNHCDTIILLKNGCDLRDTNCYNLIDLHHLIDENSNHDLGSRVFETFSDNYKDEFWSQYKNYEDAPEDMALEYACKDAIYTYRLGVSDLEMVPMELYNHVRLLSKALLETELHGINVDVELMTRTEETMRLQIEGYLPKLREEFYEYCEAWEFQKWEEEIDKRKSTVGKSRVPRPRFSFESDTQLRWLLYTGMGLPCTKKTKKGNPATDFDTIKDLGDQDIRLKTLVEYKDIKGLYATFVKGMLERVDNGRIYPHFNVSGTATGRISHSDPNMGNIPKEGPIRNFFIPSPGHVIIGADYSQLEVVVELNLTEDPGLKEIVVGGASKHDLFKAELDAAGFDLPRSQVKNVNFALQYDAQARKISKMVGCSITDAERIIEVFYNKFKGVKSLKEATTALVDREGRVTNLAGRIRRFEASRNRFEIAKHHRQAYNFLIQGVAAEACNRAFYRISEYLKRGYLGRALFSVHDEIVLEIKEEHAEQVKRILVLTMEDSTRDFNFKYPLKAVAYGPFERWQKT